MNEKYEVGEQVAVFRNYSNVPVVGTVVGITPTGRIHVMVMKDTVPTVFNPDGLERGRSLYDRAVIHKLTQEHRNSIDRQWLESRMHKIQWSKMSLDELRAIDKLIQKMREEHL